MDAERIAVAQACLDAAHDGSLGSPQIVDRLIAAGFEGYLVDYRGNTQTYYAPDSDSVALNMHEASSAVAQTFDARRVGALVRWAQANGPDYSYKAFCENMKVAGCAGYLVSLLGRRVVYVGRTAETHVEDFP